jgi:hypothetical protein
MRERIMNGLRNAGDKLLNFDERYANAIFDGTGGQKVMDDGIVNHIGMISRALPFKESDRYFPTSPYEARGGYGPRDEDSQRIGSRIDKGLIAANVASRYLLPAGGVTLAGKGLYDLTQGLYAAASATPVFGGPEDGAQPGQLPL